MKVADRRQADLFGLRHPTPPQRLQLSRARRKRLALFSLLPSVLLELEQNAYPMASILPLLRGRTANGVCSAFPNPPAA